MRASPIPGGIRVVVVVASLLGVASAVFAHAPADPAPDVQAQYRDVVGRAVIEYDAGRWAEARALFRLWLAADGRFDAQKQKCQAMFAMACERGTIETAGITDLETAHHVTAVLAGVLGAAAIGLFLLEGGGEQGSSLAVGPSGAAAQVRF